MTEILFYQLTRGSVEHALPRLLEACLSRGWKAVVQGGSRERLASLDSHLWTFRDDSFLPHGMHRDGSESDQPVFLTDEEDNPNGAEVRFLIDGAKFSDWSGFVRGVYMFDGRDSEAVSRAREDWRRERDSGREVTFWLQGESGKWEKKA